MHFDKRITLISGRQRSSDIRWSLIENQIRIVNVNRNNKTDQGIKFIIQKAVVKFFDLFELVFKQIVGSTFGLTIRVLEVQNGANGMLYQIRKK